MKCAKIAGNDLLCIITMCSGRVCMAMEGPVKAALESLVRYMAMELGPQGVRVHAVSPGPIRTRAASGIESFVTLMEENIRRSPLGRLVTLDEIAHLASFLCTDASSGMTGQTIYVDAGSHAMA